MNIISKSTRNLFFNVGRLLEIKSQTKTLLLAGGCVLFAAQVSSPAFASQSNTARNLSSNFLCSTFNNKVENSLTDDDTVNPANGTLATNHLTGAVTASRQIVLASKHYVNLGRYHGFLVNVQNDTDETWIFNGDKAIANIGAVSFPAASVDDVARVAMPDSSLSREIAHTTVSAVAAAVTVGGAAAVKDIKNQSGPVAHRYGADEARRIDEQSRFGRRVLLPGESTTGVLYFKKGKGGAAKDIDNAAVSIAIPVNEMYDAEDSNAITGLR